MHPRTFEARSFQCRSSSLGVEIAEYSGLHSSIADLGDFGHSGSEIIFYVVTNRPELESNGDGGHRG